MEIASAACSFIGSMKLTETVPAHLREQRCVPPVGTPCILTVKGCKCSTVATLRLCPFRSFSEWAYKSHLSISAFSAFAAFVLSFFVLLSNSFVANVQASEGHG